MKVNKLNEDKIKIIGTWKEFDKKNEDGDEVINFDESNEYIKNLKLLNILIEINGEIINWSYIDPYILKNYWFDHKSKHIENYEYSCFELFTCSCGVAACAGIWDGIYIKSRKHSIEWRMNERDGYKFMPKKFYSFDKEQYTKAYEDFMNWLKNEKCVDKKFCIDLGYYEGDEISVEDFLKKKPKS